MGCTWYIKSPKPQQSSMTDNTRRALVCLIEGESSPFRVKPAGDRDIIDLKDLIKEKGINTAEHAILSKDLTLWKVNHASPEDEWKHLTGKNVAGSVKLERGLDKISYHWPAPDPEHLHIIVELPSVLGVAVERPSKRRRLDDSVNSENPREAGERMVRPPVLPWLKELHASIWNRESLRPTLFRTVEVTRAHYDELQDGLNRKYPNRDSDEYNGESHDVLSDKVNILKLATPVEALSPRHLDNENRADDGDNLEDEINSFFPCTLSYLDLSTLKLENKPDRFPLPLLLRQEYDHISELITENGTGSVIVSGQPGTGKTTYLYLKIIEFLIAGRPFLYQTEEQTVYHVAETGVEVVESWSSKENIVAFVDGDQANYKPKHVLRKSSVQIIVASSPNGAYQPWIKQTLNYTTITKLVTSLWSRRELFLTGIFLYHRDITFKLLRESTSYFGYNPRECFEASHSMTRMEFKKDDVLEQIESIGRHTDSILRALDKCKRGANAASHTIFQLSPNPTNQLRQLEECHCETVSRWVFNSLLDVCERRQTDAAARLYHELSLRQRHSGAFCTKGRY